MDRRRLVRDDFPWGWLLIVLIGGAILIVFGGAGGGTVSNTNSHNNNQTHVLSDNKVASDNQVNLFSKITNCNAEGACVVTTNATTTNDVQGNDNVIVGSDGTQLCQDPSTGIYSACQ
jgi:hypothetical protein